MSLENHNNIQSWKLKLESLDSSPGDAAYNKNEGWAKLYVRLSDKKRRKNKTWIWFAAACIFLALMIPLFYSNSVNQQINNSAFKKNQASIKTPFATIDKVVAVTINNSSVAKNDITPPAVPHKTKARKNHEDKKEKFRLSYTVSSELLVPETNSNFVRPIETLSSLALIQPEKKKLRVVHINELGDPVETLPEIVRNSDKHTFQFKIANQEIYVNPATASNTNGIAILKIKPSQN
ncbi:MAG: hypothetical protein ABI359_08250 [Ginsengibacter sp.]